jgi:hypothetical protein
LYLLYISLKHCHCLRSLLWASAREETCNLWCLGGVPGGCRVYGHSML